MMSNLQSNSKKNKNCFLHLNIDLSLVLLLNRTQNTGKQSFIRMSQMYGQRPKNVPLLYQPDVFDLYFFLQIFQTHCTVDLID